MTSRHALQQLAYRAVLLASASTFIVPALAIAQDAGAPAANAPGVQSPTTPAPSAVSEADTIVVTGSRIARSRDYVAASPIATVNSSALQVTGQTTVGEALNQLPQLSGGFGSTTAASSGANTGSPASGRTLADLRGLGSPRTLVLIDGARVEPSDEFNRVDMSIIPTALLENVEIITGGASAIYGSDALAGVINVKLKQHFQGLHVDGQFGDTTDGGGRNYTVSATMGTNFSDNRGNIVLSIEHQQRNAVSSSQRPQNYALSNEFVGVLRGQAYLYSPNLPNQGTVNSIFAKYGIAAGTVNNATGYGFNRDGSIFATGPGGGAGANMKTPAEDVSRVVGDTITSATSGTALIQSPLSKYTVFGRANYDVTDDIQAYTQAFFSTYHTRNTGRAVPVLFVPTSNPFIPADFKTILNSRANPTDPFLYNSVTAATPITISDEATVWQIIAGFRGKLGIRDWTFDVSGSVGRSTTVELVDGLPNAAAFNAAINAADGGASICAGGLNLFPFEGLSADCTKKLTQNTVTRTSVYQRSIDLSSQGGLFRLPYGEVRFAAGFDYRRNGYDYRPDTFLQPDPLTGQAQFNSYGYPPSSSAGGYNEVKEGFLELSVPILAHLPFAEELSLDAAYRYSSYRIGGSASSYTFEGIWAPAKFLRFRGGYQHAIRAPSPGEAFAAATSAQGNVGAPSDGGGDPCSKSSTVRSGPNGARITALCAAQGVPVDNYINQSTGYVTITSGNVNLKPEVGDSFTIGTVLTSPFSSPWTDGLSLSIDYYKVKVTGAIGSVTARYAFDSCYNLNGGNSGYSVNNAYCLAIDRGGASAIPGSPSVINTPLQNLGAYQVSGIDFSVNWTLDFDRFGGHNAGKLNVNSIISYLDKYSIQNAAGADTVDYAGTIGNNQISGYSHPRVKANTTLTYSLDKFSLGGRWRYISPMINSLDVGSNTHNPGVPAYSYFDVFGSYDFNRSVRLHAGMTNIANKNPPYFALTAPFTDPATYDVVGRSFYLRVGVDF